MQRRKRWPLLLTILLLVIVLVVSVGIWHHRQASKQYINSTTPTLFLHGFGSSYHAEEKVVQAAKRAGVTNTVVLMNVNKKGHVDYQGPSIRNRRNPIVEINLQDSKSVSMPNNIKWLHNVMLTLKRRADIKSFNIVGHSMGNWTILAYLNRYGNDKSLPKLKKQVVLAGGGVSGWKTKNDKRYGAYIKSYLQGLSSNYPHAAVLNICGNLDDGSHSDGMVPNAVSKSLKPLLGSRPTKYQFVMVHGKKHNTVPYITMLKSIDSLLISSGKNEMARGEAKSFTTSFSSAPRR